MGTDGDTTELGIELTADRSNGPPSTMKIWVV